MLKLSTFIHFRDVERSVVPGAIYGACTKSATILRTVI